MKPVRATILFVVAFAAAVILGQYLAFEAGRQFGHIEKDLEAIRDMLSAPTQESSSG